MDDVVVVWKKVGQTPLDAIRVFLKVKPLYKDETISYAGRLDPMAEGILMLLVGEENKKRKEYEDLKKVYETEIVFGITTDTYDALGLMEFGEIDQVPSEKEIRYQLKKLIGKKQQQYPPYSSKPVSGKPLYWWARRNRLSEIEIPEKEIEIYSTKLLSYSTISSKRLLKDVLGRIELVHGNFRQAEITQIWKEKLQVDIQFLKINMEVSCSSGTYVRKIASDLGETLGCGGFANTIVRTRVGGFVKKNCLLTS